MWLLAGKKVRLVEEIIKILEFCILSVEKLFKEKFGDLKNIGEKFRVLFEENCVSEKNYKNVFKKISIFIRKIVKKKVFKKFENFRR